MAKESRNQNNINSFINNAERKNARYISNEGNSENSRAA
jgi:hypothetical protein